MDKKLNLINDSKSASTMVPIYNIITPTNSIWTITYSDKSFIVDEKSFEKIINYKKKFTYMDNNLYPSYLYNYRYISIFEFIFGFNPYNCSPIFKNNNQFDLRIENVKMDLQIISKQPKNKIANKKIKELAKSCESLDNLCKTKLTKINYLKEFHELTKTFKNVECIYEGTRVNLGKYAGDHKNPICKYINDKGEEEYAMLCNQNKLCKLCPKSYQIILDYEKENNKVIWSFSGNGYIRGNNYLFIHQVILNYYGNGRGTAEFSVDHIDRDPLNNRLDNLRIANREEQQQNSNGCLPNTKRERQYQARELPDGITHEMMPKYVNYNKECYNKEKELYREFFRIENHPNLDKIWSSSKSNKISIQDKLNETIMVLEQLNKGTYEPPEKMLPAYVTISIKKERSYLVYDKKNSEKKDLDKKDSDKRFNLKMILPIDYDLDEQLEKIKIKVNQKYPNDNLFKKDNFNN